MTVEKVVQIAPVGRCDQCGGAQLLYGIIRVTVINGGLAVVFDQRVQCRCGDFAMPKGEVQGARAEFVPDAPPSPPGPQIKRG